MKAVVAAFNQEKALVGAFSVIMNLRMEFFEALTAAPPPPSHHLYLAGAGWLGPGCSCVVENICLGSQTGRGRTNEKAGVARTSQSGSRLTGWRDGPEARKQEASLMDQ